MQELVEKAVRGDADAFLELMEMNSLSMYKTARGILKNDNDVSDAIQDTILTSFEKIHKLKNPQYFKTWLIRILINECNQILRHYKKVNTIEEVPETPRQDKTLAEFEFKEMLERRTGLPVVLWDERLTTVAAEKTLIEANVRREHRKEYVDQIAAVLILQGYLDYKSNQKMPET